MPVKKIGNLSVTIEETPNLVVYRFAGDVDENFTQQDVPRIAKPAIQFDLEQIETFNSCGIREWVYLMQDFSALGELTFVKCSVTMIDQINMVPDTLSNARVASFYGPYYCECGGEVNRLIDTNTYEKQIKAKKAPDFTCESCGKELEFDALEESYFLFLNDSKNKAS